MFSARDRAIQSQKLDRTVVTNIDRELNEAFIREVQAAFGRHTVVIGEEASSGKLGSGSAWVIDPIDGTGEYVDTAVADEDRTTCVGIALLEAGITQLSVVYNPWREEMWVADRASGRATRNDRVLNLQSRQHSQLSPLMSYDFCHWDNATPDTRLLESYMLHPPLGYYSAISQACAVAAGDSDFAVFPGDTLHDVAPGSLLIELAGGVVANIGGHQRGDLYDLRGGTIYAVNQKVCEGVASIFS
jgi:fructose-1,6-bisphosphatase/inositol monophosphatase family enzyme